MTSRSAPLPALHHTAPAHTGPIKRKLCKAKKNVFSLDGYLASTSPQLALPRSSPSSTEFSPQNNSLLHATASESRSNAISPAEALLAGDAAVALMPQLSSPFFSGVATLAGATTAPAPTYHGASSSPSLLKSTSASWRSHLLHCETQLRELVAQGVHEPPSLDRIVHVVELFDTLTREVQIHQGNAFLGTLLRLFRVEFCRAIFLDGDDVTGGAEKERGDVSDSGPAASRFASGEARGTATPCFDNEGLPQTYFEETASLLRAKAALTSTLASGVSGEALRLLERQLEDKGEQITWYEGELERMRTQYEQVAEECLGLRKTLEMQQNEAAAAQKRMQQEVQRLHVENKDLQIQLFRLRKQISGGTSTFLKDTYRQLKLSKMGLTQRLFSEGDERVALLVLLGQVESRLNEILDSYDNDFVLAHENSRRELQLKMAENVTLLLEDMHYCEASYRRLVGAHHVKIVEKGTGEAGSAADKGNGDGRSSGRTTSEPLQRIPVSVVHNGRSEEAPDESDGYVAILFDPKIYEQLQARHAIQARLQQYKKEREECAKAARARARDGEHGVFSFLSTDNTFTTTGGVAAANKNATQRETLSTLATGVFGQDPPASEGESEVRNTAADVAATPSGVSTNTPFREEKLKKWSLDSCTVGNKSNGPTPQDALPLLPIGAGTASAATVAAQSKLEKSPPLPELAKHGGGVSVQTRKDNSNTGLTRSPAQQLLRQRSAAFPPLSTTATTPQESLDDVVERQKAEWVAHILGPPNSAVAFTVPGRHPEKGDVVVVHQKSAEVVPTELMMRRVLHHPMEDLCSERFLSTVEVFTGENPAQQRLLCRVNHIDPALPIRVPESTNFVKVKYALAENAVPPGATHSPNDTVLVSAAGGGEGGAPQVSSTSAAAGESTTSAASVKDLGAGARSVASAAFDDSDPGLAVFRGNPQLRLFKELGNKALAEGNLGLQYCAGAVNSTTASTVAFQRLQPMSPNRAAEWLLYQQLFGSYRSLTPRMMEVTTIDHVMACAAERYFTRMEYRYDECYLRAAEQCQNHQLRCDMTERLFKDLHVLSDFQEALVDELEARYGFPELVAKTLYEMLCYLNAAGEKDAVLAAYLDVIRGFAAPTEIHFMAYMLYHLSYCWPESNMSTPVPVDNVHTVLEYVYRNAATIVPIKPDIILRDYDMATRSAPLNFVNFRQFFATTIALQEESILLHLHSLFLAYTQRASVDEAGWETYDAVIGKLWQQKDERRSLVRYLTSCLGMNRTSSPTLQQLTLLAASAWSSNLWE